MQINLAAAENMTANELFSAIQLLDNNSLIDVLPILLNKIDQVLDENKELNKKIEAASNADELQLEVGVLQEKLEAISRIADC